MAKTGWQAAALLMGSLAIMLGAAAWNTNRALAVAYHDLRKREAPASIDAVDPMYSAPAERCEPDTLGVPERAEIQGTRCIGGQRFEKAGNEWKQIGPC